MTGTELRRFSDCVEQIYLAAVEPERWPAAVAQVASLLDSPRGILLTPQLAPNNGGYAFPHGIDESTMQLWGTRFIEHDLWARRGVERGLAYDGNVLLDSDVATDDEFERSIFYRDFLSAIDIGRLCCGIVQESSGADLPLTTISIYRSRRARPFGGREREVCALATRHLARAFRTTWKLRESDLRMASSLAALDRLAGGVVLIGPRRQVLFANAAAQAVLVRNDGIGMRAGNPLLDALGRIVLRSAAAQEAFDLELDQALGADPRTVTHPGGGIRVDRLGAAGPYVLQIAPLSPLAPFARREQPSSAIVFLHDPDRPRKLDARSMAQVYGLTPAEVRLADSLLNGCSLAAAATNLGVQSSTVRTQLRALLQKTGTHRQSELVQLLMALSAPAPGSRSRTPSR